MQLGRRALPAAVADEETTIRLNGQGRPLPQVVNRKIKFPHLRALNALTASAARTTRKNGQDLRRLTFPWQLRALSYYDLIPEIHFASGFYARGLAGLRLYVGVVQDDGEIIPSEDPAANDLLERVKDPAGGRESLLAAYGRLAFITGDGYLLWTAGNADSEETWEYVSTLELRTDGSDNFYRIRAPGLSPEQLVAAPDSDFEPLPDTVIAYRMWTPHPAYSSLPDSPMRASLDICEELVLLTMVVRARVTSRLAGPGILMVPNEISPPPDAENDDAPGDEDAKSDPWREDLIEALLSSIEDPGSAGAVMPHLVFPPGEWIEKVKLLKLRDVEEEYRETGLRAECIGRLAVGFDMPREALEGMSGSTYMNAWVIDQQTWRTHLKPKAIEFCGNLTSAYLRPTAENLGVKDAERLVVLFDEAAVVANPDRGKDAKEVYDRRGIGKQALREATGFSDDDAPSQDDLDEMLLVAGVSTVDAEDDAVADTQADQGRDPTSEETPAQEPIEDEGQVASAHTARLVGAAAVTVMRAREMAGSRVLTKLQGHEGIAGFRTAPKHRVCQLAGRESGGPALELVEGSAGLFVEHAVASGISEKRAQYLGDLIEQHAARTLYDEEPAPLPAGFEAALRR